ncbi:MAG: hypothetical protein KAT71_08025 [Gammaproteobacteria bacterium]|nr:hypothetical protein [Gammaproteobacteria bacterium]
MTKEYTDVRTVKLPQSGKGVIIRNWITGREREVIDAILTNSVEIADGGAVMAKAGDAMTKQVHKELETFVVSIDDIKEGVLGILLDDVSADDYAFICKEIKKKTNTGK